MLEEHIINPPHKCEVCEQSFHIVADLNSHAVSHQNVCDVCRFTTTTVEHLQKHIEDTHKKKSGINCDICDFQADDETKLNAHKLEKHEQNKVTVDKAYMDSICAENTKLEAEI